MIGLGDIRGGNIEKKKFILKSREFLGQLNILTVKGWTSLHKTSYCPHTHLEK